MRRLGHLLMDNKNRQPRADLGEFDAAETGVLGAPLLALDDVLPLLASPDTGQPLELNADQTALVNAGESFPVWTGVPVLYPRVAHPFVNSHGVAIPFRRYDDPILQYLLISSIKQNHGFPNTEHSNVWYRRHMYRARELLRSCAGIALDIGCEDPTISRLMFPESVRYIGLDPLPSDSSRFRLVGLSEFLPFRAASLDAVSFMTSLDHVLDYHRAIDEATRVLKPGGSLYVASLIWRQRAELLGDHYHFHHFREYELYGALSGYRIVEEHWYTWKDDRHRFGVYLRAAKPRQETR